VTSLRHIPLDRRAQQLAEAIGRGDALEAIHVVSQVPTRNGAIVATVRALATVPEDQRERFLAWLEQRSRKS